MRVGAIMTALLALAILLKYFDFGWNTISNSFFIFCIAFFIMISIRYMVVFATGDSR